MFSQDTLTKIALFVSVLLATWVVLPTLIMTFTSAIHASYAGVLVYGIITIVVGWGADFLYEYWKRNF